MTESKSIQLTLKSENYYVKTFCILPETQLIETITNIHHVFDKPSYQYDMVLSSEINQILSNRFLDYQNVKQPPDNKFYVEFMPKNPQPSHSTDQPTHLRYTDDPEARQDNEYAEAFAHYEEIGRVCRSDSSVQNDPVLQEFRDVISQVQYSSKNTPDNIPFVFVCSSSGMGKTQLPFTLDAPSMYFLYSIGESSQNIYKIFENQSQHLMKALEHDMRSYSQLKTDPTYNLYELYMSKTFESRAAGFLVELWKRQKSSHNNSSWLKAQIIVGSFEYTKKTFQEARKELRATSEPPIVFLDEAAFTQDTQEPASPGSSECKKFRFVCNLIRVIGAPLVIMGTNLNVANFCYPDVSGDSRASADPETPWCYLVYRLPPTSKDYLQKYFDTTNSKISEGLLGLAQTMKNNVKGSSDAEAFSSYIRLYVNNYLGKIHLCVHDGKEYSILADTLSEFKDK